MSVSTLTQMSSFHTNSAELALTTVAHTPTPKRRSLRHAATTANPDAVVAEAETRLRSSSTTSMTVRHTKAPIRRILSSCLEGSMSTGTGSLIRWAMSWRSAFRICCRARLQRAASSKVLLAACRRRGIERRGGRVGDGVLLIRRARRERCVIV